MLKVILSIVAMLSVAFASTITLSADANCTKPYVSDTLLTEYYSLNHKLFFCKDSGETLGVAAVKLELREQALAPNLSTGIDAYWKWGNPYYQSAYAGTFPGRTYPNENGYYFLNGSMSTLHNMAYSYLGSDNLSLQIRLDFAATGRPDTSTAPPVGDTLHWTLSFIYFHSSKMAIWDWNTKTVPVSWVGSDTVTIRYRTIMQPLITTHVLSQNSSSLGTTVLGRYDLQGRPLDAKASPAGLVFERTPQGFRKRLQLR